LAAFFLADFSVGFFLGALFAARLELVRAPPDFLAEDRFFPADFPADPFFASFRAACFLPRDLVVRPAAGLRLIFFLAVLAAPDRFAAFLAAFFRERPPADFFAMRALLPVGYPTVNAKPRRPC
jgi:hypothetical protein